MRAILRSPIYGLLGRHVALITVTGRRRWPHVHLSRQYSQQGERVTIKAGSPERKRWRRNLREGAPVALVLRGVRRTGTARARGDERAGVTVEVELDGATTSQGSES